MYAQPPWVRVILPILGAIIGILIGLLAVAIWMPDHPGLVPIRNFFWGGR